MLPNSIEATQSGNILGTFRWTLFKTEHIVNIVIRQEQQHAVQPHYNPVPESRHRHAPIRLRFIHNG